MHTHDDLVFLLELAEGFLVLVCAYTALMTVLYGVAHVRAVTPLLGLAVAALALLVTLRVTAHRHSPHS